MPRKSVKSSRRLIPASPPQRLWWNHSKRSCRVSIRLFRHDFLELHCCNPFSNETSGLLRAV